MTSLASCLSAVFTVDFEHISHLFLVFSLVTLNKKMLVELLLAENITGESYIHKPPIRYE